MMATGANQGEAWLAAKQRMDALVRAG